MIGESYIEIIYKILPDKQARIIYNSPLSLNYIWKTSFKREIGDILEKYKSKEIISIKFSSNPI